MAIPYKPTKHSYYCSETAYDSVDEPLQYDSWESFFEEEGDSDFGYNLLFRYDFERYYDFEADKETDELVLKLFFIGQRKGIFRCVVIRNIEPGDMPKIETFLAPRWKYLQSLWEEMVGLDKPVNNLKYP